MAKKDLYIISLILLVINGILIWPLITPTHYKNDKLIKNALVLKIHNNNANCENYKEEIKKDNEYRYYLVCSKSKEITIKYLDGDVYTLKELIDKNILSTDDLIKMGLIIEKEPIKVETQEPTVQDKPSSTKPNNESNPPKVENNENDTNNSNNEKSETNNNSEVSNDKTNNKVILTTEEILEYNKQITNKTDMYYNLDTLINISDNQIKSFIEKYNLPKLPKYNGREELNVNNTQSILDNRNLENINNNIRRGIIVSRANLRSMPTNMHFYDTSNKQDFDRLQETELHINTPVLIIHESKDNLWYFVISPFYLGWIEKDKVALATKDDIEYFTNPLKFVVITDSSININNEILDMSVKLPLVGETTSSYNVVLPVKDTNNNVYKKSLAIAKKSANVGYLPYTLENIINEAEKYLGVSYSWGGMNKGVDCSSFVSNVYRTFGFTFPRNTSSQNQSVGKIISLAGKTNNQKLQLIKNTEPSLLFQNGHDMLYVGIVNNEPLIIHASGSTMQVSKTVLTNSSYLKNINKLVLVGK